MKGEWFPQGKTVTTNTRRKISGCLTTEVRAHTWQLQVQAVLPNCQVNGTGWMFSSLKGRKKHKEGILREKLGPTWEGRGMCPISYSPRLWQKSLIKAAYRREGLLWLSIWGMGHHGEERVASGEGGSWHIVVAATVRKRTGVHAGTQLTFSFFFSLRDLAQGRYSATSINPI